MSRALRQRRALIALGREVFDLPGGKAPHVQVGLQVLLTAVGRLAVVLRALRMLLQLPQ